MLLLALEGSGRGFSVALGEAGESRAPRILGSRRDDEPGAGDRLLAHVNELLDSAGLHIDSLEAIVVDRGPGSFTGVRTVVAAARGLALVSGRRVFAFDRFELLASVVAVRPGERVAVGLRAGRDRLLLQPFGAEGRALGVPRAASTRDALLELAEPAEPARTLLVTDRAAQLQLDRLAGVGPTKVRAVEVDAVALLRLAVLRIRAGLAPVRQFKLEPLYLRPPDAIPPPRLIERGDDPPPAHARAQA